MGLSLIELLVVIGVLAIVATTAITLINPQAQIGKGNDGIRKGHLLQIQQALELYRSDNNYYPPSLSDLTLGTPSYIQTLPVDPSGQSYGYEAQALGCDNSSSFCNGYFLWACLEYAEDPDADVNKSPPNPERCINDLNSYTVTNP